MKPTMQPCGEVHAPHGMGVWCSECEHAANVALAKDMLSWVDGDWRAPLEKVKKAGRKR